MGLTQAQARECLQHVLDGIVDSLLTERHIRLGTFGSFEVKTRKGRTARNPRTGAKLDIPPRAVATWKPGLEVRERIAQLAQVPPQGAVAPPDTGAPPAGDQP